MKSIVIAGALLMFAGCASTQRKYVEPETLAEYIKTEEAVKLMDAGMNHVADEVDNVFDQFDKRIKELEYRLSLIEECVACK